MGLGFLGPPTMGSLGLSRVPSHGLGVPGVPLPWDPLGSQACPPMGSLELPRVPSHGTPLGSQGSPPMGSLGLPRVLLPWGGPGPPPMEPLGLPRVPSPMGPLPWDPFGLPRVPKLIHATKYNIIVNISINFMLYQGWVLLIPWQLCRPLVVTSCRDFSSFIQNNVKQWQMVSSRRRVLAQKNSGNRSHHPHPTQPHHCAILICCICT